MPFRKVGGGKTYGRIEYGTRSKKWRAIGYKRTGGNITLGEYDTREEATARLRQYVEGKEWK